MKLWLVEQGIRNGYDTFDSMVVAAETEAAARKVHPTMTWEWYKGDHWKDQSAVWANSPDQVDVTYLGEAEEDTEEQVILASFNAG